MKTGVCFEPACGLQKEVMLYTLSRSTSNTFTIEKDHSDSAFHQKKLYCCPQAGNTNQGLRDWRFCSCRLNAMKLKSNNRRCRSCFFHYSSAVPNLYRTTDRFHVNSYFDGPVYRNKWKQNTKNTTYIHADYICWSSWSPAHISLGQALQSYVVSIT